MVDWDIEYKQRLIRLLKAGGSQTYYSAWGQPKDLEQAIADGMVRYEEIGSNRSKISLTKKGIKEAEQLTLIYCL